MAAFLLYYSNPLSSITRYRPTFSTCSINREVILEERPKDWKSRLKNLIIPKEKQTFVSGPVIHLYICMKVVLRKEIIRETENQSNVTRKFSYNCETVSSSLLTGYKCFETFFILNLFFLSFQNYF